jgi:hypothetical protein
LYRRCSQQRHAPNSPTLPSECSLRRAAWGWRCLPLCSLHAVSLPIVSPALCLPLLSLSPCLVLTQVDQRASNSLVRSFLAANQPSDALVAWQLGQWLGATPSAAVTAALRSACEAAGLTLDFQAAVDEPFVPPKASKPKPQTSLKKMAKKIAGSSAGS